METRRLLSLTSILLGIFVSTPTLAQAYAVETHANITAVTLEAYQEVYNSETFTRTDILEVVDGSIREDESVRYLNHFYDPINDRGLRGRLSDFAPVNGLKATAWVVDILKQGNYGFSSIRANEPLFSSETDFSWQRAIYEYTHGDKSYALRALGHQLHLVQDAAVPAHTRNDAHPPWDFGGDVYENYTKGRKPDVLDASHSIPHIGSIEEAITSVALFSNKNFLSRDAGFGEYTQPAENELRFEAGFGVHLRVGHKVTRASKTFDRKIKKEAIEYFFDDKDGEISKDYWRVLSKEAVRYGVATIELFFREVEEEKRTGKLLAMNKSYNDTDRVTKALAAGRDSKLSLTSLAAADVYELNKNQLDGYFAAAEIYGIHIPSAARDSALKDEQQANVLTAFEALKKTIIGEQLPDGTPPHEGPQQHENNDAELHANLDQAAALLAALQQLLEQREQECIKNSIRGPWDNFWWVGDKPGCEDPTPKITKMFWAPIQGAGGAGAVAVSGSISADPLLVFAAPTIVTWSSSGASACTVTSEAGDSWAGTSGTETSTPLGTDTRFTLTCNGDVLATVDVMADIPFEF